ncbi:MAG: flagellar biosynthesis anti-sigma factor FlgM [Phycisphaerales bacterium]|nr:flagellar biosynthesis anti-sigma factor FlgM [Phycisphaerales bacterium]
MIYAAGNATVTQPPSAMVAERGARLATAASGSHDADEVHLSDLARAHVESEAPIREDLVRRIRQEIADGSYMTDAKLDAVVDRLHREMFGE